MPEIFKFGREQEKAGSPKSPELERYEGLEPRILEAKISHTLKDNLPQFVENLAAHLPKQSLEGMTEEEREKQQEKHETVKKLMSTEGTDLESITAVVADPENPNQKIMATYYYRDCANRWGLRKKGDLEISLGVWSREEVSPIPSVASWGEWRGFLTSRNGAWVKNPEAPADRAEIAKWEPESDPKVVRMLHPKETGHLLVKGALAFDKAFPPNREPQNLEFMRWTDYIEPETAGGIRILLPGLRRATLEWAPNPTPV